MQKGILLLTLLVPTFTFSTGLANDLQQKAKLWTAIPWEGPLSQDQKFRYYVEPQLRFISRSESFDQGVLHLGLGMQSQPHLSLWLGGTYSDTHHVDKPDSKQYRLWQQIEWEALNCTILEINTRTRLEERFEKHEAGTSLRLRQKVELNFPLVQKQLAWVLSDELFFNVNHPSWVNNQVIDQNRAFIGISFPVSQNTHLKTGYLNQYMLRNPDQMNHVLNFSLEVKN